MSIVLRYLDSKCNIKEDFVEHAHLVEGMSGANIAETIVKFISSVVVDIQNCRGQDYDGVYYGWENQWLLMKGTPNIQQDNYTIFVTRSSHLCSIKHRLY